MRGPEMGWGRVPVAEAGAHADEPGARRALLDGAAQPEEGVVLHGTLPQVLAGLGMVHAEHKRVLLFLPLREGAWADRQRRRETKRRRGT